MNHLESELQNIKKSMLEMMHVVKNQLNKTRDALLNFDKERALEIMHNEKRVNGYELLIDKDCENTIALFNPVAIDLRFLLATLKINYNLERIGDNTEGIARNLMDLEHGFPPELLDKLKAKEAFEICEDMLNDVIKDYEMEDTSLARTVFKKDKALNNIVSDNFPILATHARQYPESMNHIFFLLLLFRKLERIGDMTKNVAEETIFYLEAKILKHKGNKEKKDDIRNLSPNSEG